jgi:hypothetical protein
LEKQAVRRVRRMRWLKRKKRRKEHGGRDIKMLEPEGPIVRLFPAELTLPLNCVYPEVVCA